MEEDELQQQIDDIFLEVVELEPEARGAVLDKRCDGIPQRIRREVQKLLAADDKANQANLSAAQLNVAAFVATTDAVSADMEDETIGPYRLLQKLGEGGMGVVYMAEQKEPVRRRVAIKLIKPGMDTKQVVARFEAERQALAMMEHPSIARVLDVGTTPLGRPYFVMELVKGVPITKYCDENQLSLPQRLHLFVSVCNAVQHAHQKGVIHRDLKPSNILVAEYDNVPVPKVIDFGLAKALQQSLTEKTMFTRFDQIVGTYEYMSPEQAKFNQLDIDTRTDVYSLGVLLYELLTGGTPLDSETLRSASLDERLRIIQEVEPPRPSTKLSVQATAIKVAANRSLDAAKLNTLLQGDLDSIVMKALDKERNRRYETSSALADDVKRYLTDQPVKATPPSTYYYASRFVRRHRSAVVTAVGTLVGLFVVTVGTTGLWLRSESLAHSLYEKEGELAAQVGVLQGTTEQLRQAVYLRSTNLASQTLAQSNILNAFDALESQIPTGDTIPDPRELGWYVLASRCKGNQGDIVVDDENWCLSQDKSVLATVSEGNLVCFDLATGTRTILVPRFAKEATLLAAITNDLSRVVVRIEDGLRIDELGSKKSVYIKGNDIDRQVALSPDDNWGANITADGAIQVWDVETGAVNWSVPAEADNKVSLQSIEFTNDSEHLITVLKRAVVGVIVWEVDSGDSQRIETGFEFEPRGGELIDDQSLLLGGKLGSKLVSLQGDEVAETWLPDIAPVLAFSYCAERKILGLATRGHSVQVWDLVARKMVWRRTATHRPTRVDLVNQGNDILIGTIQGASIYRLAGDEYTTSLAESARIKWPNGVGVARNRVAMARRDNGVYVQNLQTGRKHEFQLPPGTASDRRIVLTLALDPGGQNIAVSSASTLESNGGSGWLATVNTETGDLVRRFQRASDDHVFSLAYYARGKKLAGAHSNGVTIWDADTGQTLWRWEAKRVQTSIGVSPDDKLLAAGGWGGGVTVWNVENEPRMVRQVDCSDVVLALVWSPDSRWLIVGDGNGAIAVVDAKDFSVRATLSGHSDPVQALTFSPDGTTLISGAMDGRVKFWQVGSWTETAELNYPRPVHAVRCVETEDDRRFGIVVGTSLVEGEMSDVRVHWIDQPAMADRAWLRKQRRFGAK